MVDQDSNLNVHIAKLTEVAERIREGASELIIVEIPESATMSEGGQKTTKE